MALPSRDMVMDRLNTGEERLLVAVMYQAEADMVKAHRVLDGLDPDKIQSPGLAWRVLGAAALHDECARFFTAQLSALPAVCSLVGLEVSAVRQCVRPHLTTTPGPKQLGVFAYRWLKRHNQLAELRNEPMHRDILKAAREQWPDKIV